MNPWLIVGLLVAWGLSVAGVGMTAFNLGQDREKASEADKRAMVAESVDAALEVAGKAISGIKVHNSTVRQELEREIRTNTVYADCRHSDVGMRSINAAIAGPQAVTPGDGKLPAADATPGQHVWSDGGKAGGSGGAVPPMPGSSAAGK